MAEALAQQQTLQEILTQLKTSNVEKWYATGDESTEKVVEAVDKGSDRTAVVAEKLGKASQSTFDGMKASLGFVGKTLGTMSSIAANTFAMAKREGKASKLMEFGKAAIKPITSTLSKGISTLMDFLSTLGKLGLFLAAGGLLELFTNEKWQEWLKNMWTTMVEKIKTWWKETDFGALFDTFKTKFKEWYDKTVQPAIDALIVKIKGWIADFMVWYDINIKPKIDALMGEQGKMTGYLQEMDAKWTEWTTTWNELRLAVLAISIGSMFGKISPLRGIMTWMTSIFGPEGKIVTKFNLIKDSGKWDDWFGENSKLGKMFKDFKNFFGAEGKIATKWKLIKEGATFQKWFGETSTIGKMFQSFKNFFGAEGKIATAWKTIKEGATFGKWFGEGSTLKNLFTSFKSFFGPESALGKAATWVGDMIKPVMNALKGGKEGSGVIATFMRVGTWIFGAFTNVYNAVKTFLTPVMGFISGGLKIANAILTPFKALLWPITAILGVGVAVVGFVKGFLGTEGTIGEKIVGGLKGALMGVVDFFVVDMVVMVQDVLNWVVRKVKSMGQFEILGKKVDLFSGLTEFTFGDKAKQWSDNFIGGMVDSVAGGLGLGKGEKITEKTLANSDILKSGLGSLKDGKMTMDSKLLNEYMGKMDVGQLKGFAQTLGKIDAAKGIDVAGMKGIQKQLMLKLTEKTEAAKTAALNQVDQSTTNIAKTESSVIQSVSTIDVSLVGLVEGVKS